MGVGGCGAWVDLPGHGGANQGAPAPIHIHEVLARVAHQGEVYVLDAGNGGDSTENLYSAQDVPLTEADREWLSRPVITGLRARGLGYAP